MYLRPVIAHRGWSDKYPENTMLAFEKAVELGVKCIETDVTALKDYTLVLFHDYCTDRCSDFSGIISELAKDDLQRIDTGKWKDNIFAGTKICLLQSLLDLAQYHNLTLNLEFKGEEGKNEFLWDEIVDQTVNAVLQANLQENVFFSSFEIPMLRRLCRFYPQMRFGVLFSEPSLLQIQEVLSELNPQAVHLSQKNLDFSLVEYIKKQGKEVYVYTLNDPKQGMFLLQNGVDGVFTDNPDLFDKNLY
ncbi:MAG: glycerophosphodiester phosphodiesterase [Brevinemataceae bacterium]